VVTTGDPLVVEDARRHSLVRTNPAVRELGWVAYAGVPLVTRRGHVIGALSAIDTMPRLWSERDIALLRDLAGCVMTEIELRTLQAERGVDRLGDWNSASPVDATFDEAGIAIGVSTPEGRWLRVNRALCEFLGYMPEELIGRPTDIITHPDDRTAAVEGRRLLLVGECTTYSMELRYLRRSGEPVCGFATVTLVAGVDGRPRHFLTAIQDIGYRKGAEATLRQNEERYRLAAQATSDAIWDWDLLTDRMVWGDGVEALYGYPPASVGTSTSWWYERLHAEDRERVISGIQAAVARGDRVWEEEYRFRRADGSYAWIRDRGYVIADAGANPVRMIGAMDDVTAQREAEEALRQSEARYRSVLANLREVVFQVDADGRWLLLNPAWEELTGFSLADTLGVPFLEYVHPEDRAKHAELFRSVTEGCQPSFRHEIRYRTRDGSSRWMEVHARPMVNEAGEVSGIAGTLSDLTDRKRAEQLAAAQSQLLERIAAGLELADALERVVLFTEEHGTGLLGSIMLLEPTDQVLQLASGPSLPEHFRRAMASIPVHPSAGPCGAAAFRRERVVVQDIASEHSWTGTREVALASGLRACSALPCLSADGNVLGIFALYYRDSREPDPSDQQLAEIATHLAGIAIERERNQEAIRRTTRLLQQVLDTLPVGVWVLDRDGRIVFGNPASEQIWGRPHAFGVDHFDRYKGWRAETGEPIATHEWAVARALQRGETSLNELVAIESEDGDQKTLLNSAAPIRGNDGEILGAIGLHQDISEQRAQEEALRRSEEQLRQAQKMEAVGLLAGGVAHDFNNLLTGILSYSDLLLQELRQGDPIRADVEQIRHAGQRAAALTRQLLAFSRRQVLQPKVLSLNAIVSELDAMLRRVVGAGITLETELDVALWYVLADPGQLEQVLVNLVVNARDAMPWGGRLYVTTTNYHLETDSPERANGVRPGDYVALSVRDTGTGMDVPTQARIFEPFFTTKESGKGTGLGLSTVYGIVEQSGGHIAVESAPGQGATFTIYLPRYIGPSDVAASLRADRRTLPGGNETLLLVEDEAAVRSSARRLLERHGYSVLEARHGADALRIAEEHAPHIDLVLTDLVMPEMGGRELVERLRARHPRLKVLYMSGYSDKAISADGILPPGTGFVEKPFSVDQLMQRLREILDS
jgi:PAS domain S-box-containing protein